MISPKIRSRFGSDVADAKLIHRQDSDSLSTDVFNEFSWETFADPVLLAKKTYIILFASKDVLADRIVYVFLYSEIER